MTDTLTGLELRSLATSAGELRLALIETTQPEPKPDEVVVRIEATPINPSDLGLLLANADLATLRRSGDELVATIPQWGRTALRPRLDQSLPVGNEGAGTVVRAGTNAQQMLGQRVGMWGGGMYAQFRTIAAEDVQPLPEGISAVNGAAMFINPLTALGFVDTMKTDGHRALVHFAAASNLGQMLNRICLKDKIPLVNVVRSEAQVSTQWQ
jgi:NADPH:quinone reductase-like Zn-dependent oxidoreductase